jgi:hypothetical protein
MTKIITRYFEDIDVGRAVKRELTFAQNFSPRILRLFETTEGMVDSLTSQGVEAATAEAYAKRLATGGAVLLVRAGFKPLCVAQTTREITATMGAVDMGGLVEEVVVKDDRRPSISVLTDHRHMMTRPLDSTNQSTYMANWPIPLISRRKPFSGFVFEPHARMANWPISLISRRKPSDNFAFPRHARMANFILPLLSKRKPKDNFAFPRHARMANFPLPLISKRKPYTGSLIGRHTRMANWPFPHLINGRRGTNSLMPNGPRMANFPIPLLSDRKPSDSFAFPRHARMANFPIGLISKRKPSDKFAFPRHARMADFPIPLVISRTERTGTDGPEFAERRGYFGFPTVIRR